LTCQVIFHRWPELALAPAKLTLWKLLGRAVQQGRVLREGRGNRKDPYVYWVPGMVEKWQQEFMASFMKRLEENEPKPPRHSP
jgi:hypothetical protein